MWAKGVSTGGCWGRRWRRKRTGFLGRIWIWMESGELGELVHVQYYCGLSIGRLHCCHVLRLRPEPRRTQSVSLSCLSTVDGAARRRFHKCEDSRDPEICRCAMITNSSITQVTISYISRTELTHEIRDDVNNAWKTEPRVWRPLKPLDHNFSQFVTHITTAQHEAHNVSRSD